MNKKQGVAGAVLNEETKIWDYLNKYEKWFPINGTLLWWIWTHR